MAKPVGWRNESRRHSLASKGIKTAVAGKPVIRAREPVFTSQELYKIGKDKGLAGRDVLNFVPFMQKRFPTEMCESYIKEWAGRFHKGTEFVNGDGETRKALIAIDPKTYKPVEEYGGFVFKEGHRVLYPKHYKGTGEDREIGTVIENEGKTALVDIGDEGKLEKLPVNELDLTAFQPYRD